MEVLRTNSAKSAQWDEYVFANNESTFYHLFGWKQIIEKSFGHRTYYLTAMSGKRIAGILPIVHIKSRLFGSIFCSMPFMGIGGICADDQETAHVLLEAAGSLLKKEQGDYLELRHRKQTDFGLPVKRHKVTMTVELDPDPEVLWKGFKSKHRTAVRRAEKNNLEITLGQSQYLDLFYEIESVGWRDLGTPFYRKSFFENILGQLGQFIDIYMVFQNGQPVATAFNARFKGEVEGMWTYCLKEYSGLQTNYYLYWQMIKQACENGFNQFHLGRTTPVSGGAFYKSKWNAVPRPLYWEYVLNKASGLPALDTANPRFAKMIDLWKKLPVSLTRQIGPFIAKNIP